MRGSRCHRAFFLFPLKSTGSLSLKEQEGPGDEMKPYKGLRSPSAVWACFGGLMDSSESRNCLLMIKRPYVRETMQITSRASSASQTYESSWAQGSRRKVFREKQTEAAAIAWVSPVLPWFLSLYVCAGKSFPESDFSATCSTAGHVESDLLVSLHHRLRQTYNASFLMTCVFFRSRQI